MKTDDSDNDPLLTAANTAWLEYAKGTYSATDKRIFIEGFRRGWQSRHKYVVKLANDDIESYLGEKL